MIKAKYQDISTDLDEIFISNYSVLEKQKNSITLEKDGCKYHCRLLHYDKQKNFVLLKVNGKRIEVTLERAVDSVLKKFGISSKGASEINELNAPMPGVVLTIKVRVGNKVKKGDPLIVLEAMKMENVLGSPIDGVIESIEVNENDTIEKNTVLIKFQKK